MPRRIPVIAACAATLAFSALPASAMTSQVHGFTIPGVYGVRAWGTYAGAATRVRVTVCVEDTARCLRRGSSRTGVRFQVPASRQRERCYRRL
jgi:hypothetical protein